MQLLYLTLHKVIDIKRSGFKGRKLNCINLVEYIKTLGQWNGRCPLITDDPLKQSEYLVLLILEENHGVI